MLNRYRLNDEGRNARVAERYKFEERELLDPLAEYGITPDTMRENKEMANLMKGYATNTPVTIYKTINGERKELGEACFQAIRSGDGIELKALPVLKTAQYDSPAYKNLFDDNERAMLAGEGRIEGTKFMKDFASGRECECYVAYHEPTRRLVTLPVDEVRIPKEVYKMPLQVEQQEALRSGKTVLVENIKRRNGQLISGTLRIDPLHRGAYFSTGDNLALKVGDTINGAKITPEQQKMLEERKTVFIRGMRSKNGKTYSDDVRYSDSNILLIGDAARNYRSKLTLEADTSRRNLHHRSRSVASIPAQTKSGKKVGIS